MGHRSIRFRSGDRSDKFAVNRESICANNLGLDWDRDRCGDLHTVFDDLLVGGDILGFVSDDFRLRAVFDSDEFFLPGGLPGKAGGDEGGADV